MTTLHLHFKMNKRCALRQNYMGVVGRCTYLSIKHSLGLSYFSFHALKQLEINSTSLNRIPKIQQRNYKIVGQKSNIIQFML
jgi:hypothetical protein